MACLPLFWATPASANQTSFLEAQQQLAVAEQELSSASAALQLSNTSVSAATVARDEAQANLSSASAAWEATRTTVSGTSTVTTQNVVRNGTFDSTDHWSSVVASNTVYTGGSSPIIINGTLKGSWNSGFFVLQTGTFPSPTRQVEFAVDVWNYDTNEGNRVNNPDYYRIEFRTYAADGTRLNYFNLQHSQWHDWLTRGATYTFDRDAVTWDVGFRMADNGYWAGAFGPVMDNVRVIATMGTTTPDTYTYGEAETQARDAAQQALQSAQIALNSATTAQTAATARLDAAIDEVVRLTNLVEDLTPRLLAPTNLTLNITENGVELSWTAPEPNASGVIPERYAIGWSTTNFTENGWGWGHGATSVTIPFDVLRDHGGLGNEIQFRVRADNDTQSIYSGYSNVVATVVPIPEPQATPPTVPQGALVFSENQVAELVAPQYHRISFIAGYYGDPSDSRNGLDVSSVLAQYVGSQSASIPATNEMFTDTAPGIPKILILLVTYELDSALQTAAQEAARLEAERIAAEQAAEAARLEAIRLESERLAAEEAARVAAQQAAAAAAEAARLEAERVERERVAALEAAERLRQEQLAAEAERARLAAEEAARLAAAEAARIAAEEAARLAAEEAARLEAERIAAEEAARLAAEEAARLEAERLEAERLAKLEAERLEAERLEAERIAAEKAAAEKAERLEALEKARAEKQARLEAERIAEEKAAEEEAERLAALEKAKAEEEARLEAEEKAREEAEAEANKPTPTEEPVVVEIKEPITAENITAVVEELATVAPQQLTKEQQTLITEAALETFQTAEQGSPEYEAALEALLVVAQADDIVLDEELAAIPLIGNVAGAAVEVFNALGNAGADMSPQVREQSEKVVIAAVIVGQVAMTATAAATSAAAAAARRP